MSRTFDRGVHKHAWACTDCGATMKAPIGRPVRLRATSERLTWQRLYLDGGLTIEEVAERVGQPKHRIAYGLMRLGTTMRRGTSHQRDTSRDERMLELARAGRTYTEIGAAFHLTRERVRQILHAAGLSKDEIHALVLARKLNRKRLLPDDGRPHETDGDRLRWLLGE